MTKQQTEGERIVAEYAASQGDSGKCPHCGEVFANDMLRDDKRVPTHDFPKPCRQVCPGAGEFPIPDGKPLVAAIDAAIANEREQERNRQLKFAKQFQKQIHDYAWGPTASEVIGRVITNIETAAKESKDG